MKLASAIAITTIFVLLAHNAAALQWSEIMFNPLGNDNGKEFVELVGTEDLAGCFIHDSASQDTLIVEHRGLPENDVILILENDSDVLPAGRDATVYVIGAAIGNGLGNTWESLNITCGGTTLLNTSYNVSLLPGYKEGESIVFIDDAWQTGPMNGTPGVKYIPPINQTNATNQTNSTNPTNTSTNPTEPPITSPQSSGKFFCNASLAITVSATAAAPGEHVLFTIVSDAYAEYDITADNVSIAAGDTLTTKEHSVIVPHGKKLQIQAIAHACGGRQRASRTITILDQQATNTTNETNETPVTATPTSQENATVSEALKAAETVAPKPKAETPAVKTEPAQATGAVVLDENRSAVPWICAFGIITLLVSGAVFFKLRDAS